MGLMFRIIIHYLKGDTSERKGAPLMRQKPGVPVIYSVRPLGHSVLKVKLGKGPLDRGSAISDYFLPWLQAPHNLSIRETVERPEVPLSAPLGIQDSGPEWGPSSATS